jgi:ABC-type antimicrobial peptide transport system permease subunit
MINFAARKQDFLIYRTIGLPKRMIMNAEFLEALSMGLYSGVCGIVAGLLLLPAVLQILTFYVGALEYSVNPTALLVLILISCALAVFSVLITVRRQVMKRNLIAELKRD